MHWCGARLRLDFLVEQDSFCAQRQSGQAELESCPGLTLPHPMTHLSGSPLLFLNNKHLRKLHCFFGLCEAG